MKISILFHLALAAVHAASLSELNGTQNERRAIASKEGFQITFFDDFTRHPCSSTVSSEWIVDTGTSYPGGPIGWGNGESESYTASPASLALSDSGTLLIAPQLLKNGQWISGRIETARSDFVCAAGGKMYIESRLKVGDAPAANQQGIWPAFWSLGSAFRGNFSNWPAVGEWDFFESINGLSQTYTTIHCGMAPGGFCNEFDGIGNGGSTPFSRGVFHVVGFMVDLTSGNWETESLTWFLDDWQTFRVTGSTIGDQATWNVLAHNPHFLLFNVAVGGSFPSAVAGMATPTNSTIGGETVGMEVDYVVVYNS